jgi:hypothetical protein
MELQQAAVEVLLLVRLAVSKQVQQLQQPVTPTSAANYWTVC